MPTISEVIERTVVVTPQRRPCGSHPRPSNQAAPGFGWRWRAVAWQRGRTPPRCCNDFSHHLRWVRRGETDASRRNGTTPADGPRRATQLTPPAANFGGRRGPSHHAASRVASSSAGGVPALGVRLAPEMAYFDGVRGCADRRSPCAWASAPRPWLSTIAARSTSGCRCGPVRAADEVARHRLPLGLKALMSAHQARQHAIARLQRWPAWIVSQRAAARHTRAARVAPHRRSRFGWRPSRARRST